MPFLSWLVSWFGGETSMLIVGFGAKARQGKDTAGEAILMYFANQAKLIRRHGLCYNGPRVVLCKFARSLYKECEELHGMTEKDPVLLQRIGVERRAEDPDYWIKRAFDTIPQQTDIVIFTDVRFQNEAERIKKEGGYTVEVVRLNQDGTRFYSKDRSAWHQSEVDLDFYNWDYYLTAKSGETALLGEQAITLVEYIRGLESK